jgi:protein-L-isoaspartate(D-aspartate) O-methyltransferase
MDDFEQARQVMIEGQLRPNGVADQAILAAMRAIPREIFLPPEQQVLAYADINIVLQSGGVMVSPLLAAQLLQAADVHPGDRVLVIPALGGYMAALLAHMQCHVVTVDPTSAQAQKTDSRCHQLKLSNIQVAVSNPTQGFADAGPYQAIIIPGGTEVASPILVKQLLSRGRLVTILKSSRHKSQVIALVNTDGVFSQTVIANGVAPILEGFSREVGFVF